MLTMIRVHDNDVSTLQGWLRSSSIRAGLAQRARIVLLSGEGLGTSAVAERIRVSRPTVILWRDRYRDGGVEALADLPRPGRPSDTDEAAIVVHTLEAPPERLAGTHWSSRLLAREMGVSNVTIAKVWRKWGLQPWRTERRSGSPPTPTSTRRSATSSACTSTRRRRPSWSASMRRAPDPRTRPAGRRPGLRLWLPSGLCAHYPGPVPGRSNR